MISVRERPDAYKARHGRRRGPQDFQLRASRGGRRAADEEGREQRGIGDNVVKYPNNLVGIARYIRSSERVLELLTARAFRPTPSAMIDDSGGTLTAPILEQFKGVICAGGTVRSHLGILTREYGIPCLMNAKISGIRRATGSRSNAPPPPRQPKPTRPALK